MTGKQIPKPKGYKPKPEWENSFSGSKYAYCEISGPGTLVRLVQYRKITSEGVRLGASRTDGAFWFDERLLIQIRTRAYLELSRQQREVGRPFSASLRSLMALYMRHVVRNELAVCKDWTSDFDGYVRLRLLATDKLVAMAGKVGGQAAYSPADPRHAAVVAQNILLAGGAKQYVIDFTFDGNPAYLRRINGPFELG